MKVFLKILLWVGLVALVIFVVMLLAIIISGRFSGFGDLFSYLVDRYNEGNSAVRAALFAFTI